MSPFFSDDFKEEVRANNDIVSVVGRYVKLKKTGNRHWGLCPFHRESTPSFTVSTDSGLYHCFGCSASGDVYKFVMEMEHADFPEAMKLMADWAGLKVPESMVEDRYQAQKLQKKQRYYALNADAARYFYMMLHEKESTEAQQYITKRGLAPETIKQFGIGYAPDGWDGALNYLKEKGYTQEEMLAVGVIVKNAETGRVYDRFRDRIMFPIFDMKKQVIGFGGRIVGKGEPKYMNSPESDVFVKSRHLFALNFTRGAMELIITEGYMDVISLHQNGVKNAVATLGTAMNEEHAKVMGKVCKEAILCYDSDKAGQDATMRAIDILIHAGIGVRCLTLSQYKDPDEYMKLLGVERFRQEVKQAKSWVEFKIDRLRTNYDLEDTHQKIQFANEAAKIFARVKNAIEQDAIIRKIAAETGISSQAFLTQIAKVNESAIHKSAFMPQQRKKSSQQTEDHGLTKRQLQGERLLIYIIAVDASVAKRIAQTFSVKDFDHPIHHRLATMIMQLHETGKKVSIPSLFEAFDENEQSAVAAVFNSELQFDDHYKAAMDIIHHIQSEKRLRVIHQNIQEGNVAALNDLLKKHKHLSQ
ncbi:MAG: DNA primase [Hyphomonadaceae bacterium]|nr:DNA primase [Clostridia bacterium]